MQFALCSIKGHNHPNVLSYLVMKEEAEHLATVHPSRALEVLVPFDDISLEWEELKRTLQGCEDSLMVASRLQSFIQVHRIVHAPGRNLSVTVH